MVRLGFYHVMLRVLYMEEVEFVYLLALLYIFGHRLTDTKWANLIQLFMNPCAA
jgi:hypothetical protein